MGETGKEGSRIDTTVKINELSEGDLKNVLRGWKVEDHAAGLGEIGFTKIIGGIEYQVSISKPLKSFAFHSLHRPRPDIAIETGVSQVDRVEFDHSRQDLYIVGSERYRISNEGLHHSLLTKDGKRMLADFWIAKPENIPTK